MSRYRLVRERKFGSLMMGLLVMLAAVPSGGAYGVLDHSKTPIRLSFLDSDAERLDTIDRLTRAGCSPDVMKVLERFIAEEGRRLMWTGDALNRKQGDVFLFESVDEFMGAAPPEFSGYFQYPTNGKRHSLMCFDFAMLVMRDGPVRVEMANERFDSTYFVIPQMTSRGGLSRFAVTAMTDDPTRAVGLLLSSEAAYTRLTGYESRSRGEEALALSLRAARGLPGHFANSEIALRKLFDLRADLWRREGVSFSPEIQIVLAQYVDFRERFIGVDHVGLAVPGESGWMYLEKNGTTNPIIRIDFRSRDEITEYVARLFEWDQYNPRSPLHHAAFLVSFNEELVWVRPRERLLLKVSNPL